MQVNLSKTLSTSHQINFKQKNLNLTHEPPKSLRTSELINSSGADINKDSVIFTALLKAWKSISSAFIDHFEYSFYGKSNKKISIDMLINPPPKLVSTLSNHELINK